MARANQLQCIRTAKQSTTAQIRSFKTTYEAGLVSQSLSQEANTPNEELSIMDHIQPTDTPFSHQLQANDIKIAILGMLLLFDGTSSLCLSNCVLFFWIAGVGGAGCNTINNMQRFQNLRNTIVDTGITSQKGSIEFIAVNTDVQCLEKTQCTHRVQIGVLETHGLGAG